MSPTTKERLKKFFGYPSFFFSAFGLMLYLTFPYATVAERISAEAKKNGGLNLHIGKLGPGFLGLKAKEVAITPPRAEGQQGELVPVVIDEVSARPSLFPLGLAFNAKLFGGQVKGSFSPLRRSQLLLTAREVELARGNLKSALGLDLSGKLGANINLAFDPNDFTKAVGRVQLEGQELVINGGTVANYDLPKVDLGTLDADFKFEDGKAVVESFSAKGSDVEAALEGQMTLASKLMYSMLQFDLKFKPAEDFLKRNSFIATGLSFAMTKDPQGYYKAKVDRLFGNPRFSPQR
ncbi:MAG: type II secretion system protein GspN [Myxococcales bacterium]